MKERKKRRKKKSSSIEKADVVEVILPDPPVQRKLSKRLGPILRCVAGAMILGGQAVGLISEVINPDVKE